MILFLLESLLVFRGYSSWTIRSFWLCLKIHSYLYIVFSFRVNKVWDSWWRPITIIYLLRFIENSFMFHITHTYICLVGFTENSCMFHIDHIHSLCAHIYPCLIKFSFHTRSALWILIHIYMYICLIGLIRNTYACMVYAVHVFLCIYLSMLDEQDLLSLNSMHNHLYGLLYIYMGICVLIDFIKNSCALFHDDQSVFVHICIQAWYKIPFPWPHIWSSLIFCFGL